MSQGEIRSISTELMSHQFLLHRNQLFFLHRFSSSAILYLGSAFGEISSPIPETQAYIIPGDSYSPPFPHFLLIRLQLP